MCHNQTCCKFNSGIGIDYLKKKWNEFFGIGIEVSYKIIKSTH